MTGFFHLSESERRLHVDHAGDAVREIARQAMVDGRAHKPDPRSVGDYQAAQSMKMFCALVVKIREPRPGYNGLPCSMDGDPGKFFYLPISKIITQPESLDSFVLVLIPRWLGKSDKLPQLMGCAPELFGGDWTKEQRETWKHLRRKRDGINVRIRNPKHSARERLRFGEFA